MEDKNVESVAN